MEHVRAEPPDQVDEGLQVTIGHPRRELGDLDRCGRELALQERSLEMSGNHHLVTGTYRRLGQGQRADHMPYAEWPTSVTTQQDPHQPAARGFCLIAELMATRSGRDRRTATTSFQAGGASGSSATSARNRTRSS